MSIRSYRSKTVRQTIFTKKRLKLTPCLSFPRGLKILSHIRNTRNNLSLRTYFNLKSNQNMFAQAIQSSPEGRLTLAQIYDWMIASVPYFTQRADSTSSAGWKVTQHFLQTFNFTSIFLETLTLTFCKLSLSHLMISKLTTPRSLQNSIRHNLSLHQRFLKVQN